MHVVGPAPAQCENKPTISFIPMPMVGPMQPRSESSSSATHLQPMALVAKGWNSKGSSRTSP